MALFFMRKINWPLIALVTVIILNGRINSAALWSVCMISSLLYIDISLRAIGRKIDAENKAMGARLIDGMKALTELCKNAFDHIKTNKQQIDKLSGKVTEHNSRIQRLDNKTDRTMSREIEMKNKRNLNIDQK